MTNAWQAAYNMLEGIYEYNIDNGKLSISEDLKSKRKSILAMEEVKMKA